MEAFKALEKVLELVLEEEQIYVMLDNQSAVSALQI